MDLRWLLGLVLRNLRGAELIAKLGPEHDLDAMERAFIEATGTSVYEAAVDVLALARATD